MNESVQLNVKKYKQAGIGFFILNLIYLGVAMAFLPPMGFGGSAYLSIGIYILLMAWLGWLIFGGRRRLTLIFALIYAARFFISVWQLAMDEAFLAVPYILPCLALTFYLLGRAVWDWR